MSRERKGSVSGAAGQPQRDQEFAEKGRLKTTLFLCSCRAETITYQQLAEAQSKTCRALGQEINLVIIRGTHSESDAPIPLIAVVAANDPRIFGAYELSNYSDGVVFKRICDLIVVQMLEVFGSMGKAVKGRCEPIAGNEYAGSRVLPSGLKPEGILMLE